MFFCTFCVEFLHFCHIFCYILPVCSPNSWMTTCLCLVKLPLAGASVGAGLPASPYIHSAAAGTNKSQEDSAQHSSCSFFWHLWEARYPASYAQVSLSAVILWTGLGERFGTVVVMDHFWRPLPALCLVEDIARFKKMGNSFFAIAMERQRLLVVSKHKSLWRQWQLLCATP